MDPPRLSTYTFTSRKLFRRVNSHFYDFGVRVTHLNFGNLLMGFLPNIWENRGCCQVPQRAFACAPRRRRPFGSSWQIEAGAALGRRQKPFSAPGKTPDFLKDWGETHKQISEIYGVPLTLKSKNANFSS